MTLLPRNPEAAARYIATAPELVEALNLAVATIRLWHGMGCSREDEPRLWLGYQNSPEMKRINAVLRKAEGR